MNKKSHEMKMTKTITSIALFGLLSVGMINAQTAMVSGPKVSTMKSATHNSSDTPSIVGVASSNDQFSTLVAAVGAADLVGVLEGEGPFTVFAPTNEAFGALPKGTVETLLQPENKNQLVKILTYHVVSGKFMAQDVVNAIKGNDGKFSVKTVQGGKITLTLENGAVMLTDTAGNKSKVIITDVAASNGVIHAIDRVIMP
jgi:uncharacterized surface protein with fasciclin (FAS1) repeats